MIHYYYLINILVKKLIKQTVNTVDGHQSVVDDNVEHDLTDNMAVRRLL